MADLPDDPIERLRLHLERHKNREQAFFSIAGLRVLLDRHDAMKAQIERLLGNRAKEISEAVKRLKRTETIDPKTEASTTEEPAP